MIKSIAVIVTILIAVLYVSLRVDPLPLDQVQRHMLLVSGMIMLGVALGCFILAEITANYSQVDKLWSIIPVVYVWSYMYMSHWDARTVLMGVCVTIWGARLTYNFGRKGGYHWKFWTGEEDYRWEVLRQNPTFRGKVLRWKLFSFFFIALYQHFLLWLITLPALLAYSGRDIPLGIWDYGIAVLIITLIAIETIADQQQWRYQTEKHRLKKAGVKPEGEYAVGFIRTGLFALSRHPNYAAEQAIWLVFYLFSIVATGAYINWTMTGCLLLMVLFQGSADFSEGISMGKYPLYAEYVRRVRKFV